MTETSPRPADNPSANDTFRAANLDRRSFFKLIRQIITGRRDDYGHLDL